ncbi:MAG: hypothetical protein R6V57_16265 [Vicinamibacterales bacterium]
MTETSEPTGPLAFAARFPPEERFAAIAAELAARLAAACGCAAGAAEEIRSAVRIGFEQALAGAGGEAGIDLTLRAGNGVFDADLASGGSALCHCSKSRTS